jgi:hypothetical protein
MLFIFNKKKIIAHLKTYDKNIDQKLLIKLLFKIKIGN